MALISNDLVERVTHSGLLNAGQDYAKLLLDYHRRLRSGLRSSTRSDWRPMSGMINKMASRVVTMPPTTTRARGCWVWAPIPVATAAGSSPMTGGKAGHYDRAHLVEAARCESDHRAIFLLSATDSREKNHRTEGGDSGERSESDRRRDAKGGVGEEEGEDAADRCKRQRAHDDEGVTSKSGTECKARPG